MKESDLYPPLKTFLEQQGYEVKGEVGNCDVLAVRETEEPVIVELKLTLNLSVVLQCVERLGISSKVYVGVPRRCSVLKRQRRSTIKMLKMLGLGLLAVDHLGPRQRVEVVLDPSEYRPRKNRRRRERLLGEFAKRVGDPNLGGTAMRDGVVTAYRQQATTIAHYLHEHGDTKASEVAMALSLPKARQIMYRDVYGWFERVSTGIYRLSPRGLREAANPKAGGWRTSHDGKA